MTTEPRLTVRKAGFGYGHIDVVREVDVDVGLSEVVSLVGRNGAGKTTLCLGIAGVHYSKPEGSVRWCDREIMTMSPEDHVKLGVTLVPEGRRIFRRLSVQENLELGAFAFEGRQRRSKRSEGIARVFDLFPILRAFANRRAGELSGGQQQMIAIGQAIVADPKILILDDPCAGLAESVIEELYRTIRLLGQSVGVLVVDQVISRALENTERTYVMEGGRIALSGRSDQVRTDPRLESIVMGEASTILD